MENIETKRTKKTAFRNSIFLQLFAGICTFAQNKAAQNWRKPFPKRSPSDAFAGKQLRLCLRDTLRPKNPRDAARASLVSVLGAALKIEPRCAECVKNRAA
jgi:hypothetical protein